MISGLILVSGECTVTGEWVDEVTVIIELSSSFVLLFVLRGKTFNDSSVCRSLDIVVTSISKSVDNDDDVAGWGDDVEGTFVSDCDDNVVISETGVGTVVTVNKGSHQKEGTMNMKSLEDIR
jgi:hypothetical protein